MKMKRLACMLLASAMVISLAACGSKNVSSDSATEGDTASADKPVTLVIGNVAVGEDHPYTMGLNWMKEYLEEHNSTVSLDIQNGGVLGSEVEECQQVILGTQDMVQMADMSTTSFEPKMAFANFPMLFEDYDDVLEGWSEGGWAFNEASELLAGQNLTLLGAGDNGFRIISDSKRPITCVADIAGLKIRVPEVDLLQDIWKEFGAQATPIAFGELTTALQQGTVDGQELGLQSFYDNRWDDFQKYITLTNYDYSAFLIMINTDIFNSLSEQQQADLKAAAQYGCQKEIEYSDKYCADGLAEMLADGKLQQTEMTDAFRDEIYAIGYKIAHTDKWEGILGEDLVNTLYPSETRS